MPSPNVSTKPQDKADFGNRLSKKKSQEYAAKIARWNTNGGGMVPENKAEPAVVVVEADSSDSKEQVRRPGEPVIQVVTPDEDKENQGKLGKSSPALDNAVISPPQTPDKNATARKASKEIDLGRQAWVRRKSKTQADKPAKVDIPTDVKHAGTPKKRVVSDGHWRRDRLAKAETPEKTEPTPKPVPKPIVIRNSVVSVGLKVPPTVQTFVQQVETKPRRHRTARKSRSTSRSRSRERKSSSQMTPDYESSGTKVYVKRREPSKNDSRPPSRDFKSSESSLTTSSVEKRASTGQTTPVAIPSPAKLLTPPSATVARYLNTLVPVQDQANPDESASLPDDARIRRRRSSRRTPRKVSDHKVEDLELDKRKNAGTSPLGQPQVYGSRIEGWLAHTSDPFMGGPATPKEQSAVPRHASHRRSRHSPNDHDDYDRHERKPSAPGSRQPTHSPELSPITTSLKRRGARRTATSPVKDRSSREGSPLDQRSDYARRPVSRALESPLRREVSGKGRELATITSIETFRGALAFEDDSFHPDGSMLSRASDGDERHTGVPLKRRLTKHSDLISVLSVEHRGSKSVRPRHSTRSRGNAGDIMNDITTDELKYQRELRTLVDGVIPVLLNYVLSNAETKPSRLLGGAVRNTQTITQPIVDMGVVLERLKSTHKRIPMHNTAELLKWAAGAKVVYADYLKSWRLGFQDIVVNLAPAESIEKQSTSRWDDGLPRNDRGELTSGDGERVDVAYLLKRPLVRLKHLSKAFDAIVKIDPTALDTATAFHYLVLDAKRRANEEKARLEDEAAASIDPTRARECRTLAPIAGVKIDATRCVRARDFFDLDLRHSNGQQLNCKVELIMRDDASGMGDAGDVLFCEISPTGRWLLFPPVHTSMISARQGRKEGQIVVMLRGYRNDGREWREVLALDTDDSDATTEWLSMLPSSPVPRNLATKSSFDLQKHPLMSGALPDTPSPGRDALTIVKENEIPIGEQATETSMTWDASEVNSDAGSLRRRSTRRARHQSHPLPIPENETFTPQRTRDQRYHARPRSEQISASTAQYDSRPSSRNEYNVWLPSRHGSRESSADEDEEPRPTRPGMQRRTSSVPSMEFPTVQKLRKVTQVIAPRTHETQDTTMTKQDRDIEDPSSTLR